MRAPDLPAEKKPRGGELTCAQKQQNREYSRIRVRVEHALAGVKRSRITKEVLRNCKAGFSDLAMVVACGLHNFRLQHRRHPLRLDAPVLFRIKSILFFHETWNFQRKDDELPVKIAYSYAYERPNNSNLQKKYHFRYEKDSLEDITCRDSKFGKLIFKPEHHLHVITGSFPHYFGHEKIDLRLVLEMIACNFYSEMAKGTKLLGREFRFKV